MTIDERQENKPKEDKTSSWLSCSVLFWMFVGVPLCLMALTGVYIFVFADYLIVNRERSHASSTKSQFGEYQNYGYSDLRLETRFGRREAVAIYSIPNSNTESIRHYSITPTTWDIIFYCFSIREVFSQINGPAKIKLHDDGSDINIPYGFVYIIHSNKIIAERSFDELNISLDEFFDGNAEEKMKIYVMEEIRSLERE